MATLLHVYAKITWRGGEDAAVKQAAALQLLTEPYCRLSLSMLPSAIAKEAPGASLESLTQILGPDPHFTVDRSTGNVLLNSAELLQSGKSTLKQLVERAWPQHGVDPHQWACHQLARYVIEGQQMDVRTADLFTARLEGAEKFLVGAWTCCQLRQKCGIALPFTSIEKLLEQDSTKLLQLWPAPAPAAGPGVQQHQGGTMIKLHFSNLLSLHHNSPHPPPAPAPQQQPQQLGRGTANGTGGSSSSGGDVLGKAGAAEATVGKLHSNGGSVEAAMGSLQAMNINGQQQQQQQQPRGQGGLQGSTWADEADEEHGAYGDAGGEYGNGYEHDEYGEYDEDHEDGDEAAGGEVGQAAGGRASGLPGAHSGGANASGAAAGADGRAAGPNGGRMRLPLRPDLMKSYLWAVFGADGGGGPGGAKDVLAALAAAALVHAGRGRQPPSYNSPAAGALRDRMHAEAQERRQATDGGLPMWNFDPLCFSMPLAKLAAHLQAAAPKALPPAGGAAGAVSQALRDPRHGRGCFRFMALPAAEGRGGGTVEDVLGADEEEVVVLDLGLLRERVVEALTVAAKATFQPISGRMPDMLRYLTTVHLASLTQSFAGRAHCVRLASLARHLAEAAPDAGCHEFDPSRLDGLARILTTTPGPVLFTMDRPMPGSGKPVRLVSLNVGKLIETAERNGWVPGGGGAAAAAASRAPPAVPAPPAPAQEAAVRLSVAELWSGGGADATVKRQAALRLLAALYTQPGGLLPLVRLHDALRESLSQTVAAQAGLQQVQQLERLLRTESEVFELQTQWSGGPLGARLRVGSLLAKAEAAKASQAEQRRSAAVGHGGSLGSAAYHNPHQHQSPAVPSKPAYNATGAPALQQQQQPHPYPLRPGHAPCPYYVRNGTCGYGNACKYDHPVHLAAGRAATPQAESAATAAAAAAAAAAAVAAASAAAATVAPRSAPQAPPPPPQQPHNQHQPHAPPRASSSSGSGFYPPSATTPTSTPIPTTAPASSLSPTSLEVHVITTACTPDHLDMLQHCYAAGQVSLCCKHQQLTHTHTLAAAEAGAPVLVQLYVPAVTSGWGAGGSSSSNSSKAGGAGGAPGGGGGGGAGGGGGNGGGGGREWPATVYLVDPAGAGDRGALLLGSLCALLEDAAVTKVVYCGKEVVPSLARGCHARLAPMRDVTVLHAMTEAMAAAVAGGSIGGGMGGGGSTPLATLLQAHGLLTAAAVPALTAAPGTSPLWSERPLGATLRQQAVLEVAHLPALWAALMARLTALPQQLSQATGDALAAQVRGLQDGPRQQQQQQQATRPQVQQIALPQQHQHQHQPQQAPVSHGLTRPGQQHQHPHQHQQQQASYGSGGGSSAGTSHYSTSAAGAGGGGSMRYGAAGGTLAGGGGGGGGPLARPSVGQPGVGLGSGMGGSMSMGSGDVRRAAPSRGPSRY